MTREITLADILACLKEQKDEIKDAKEETTNKLDKFMKALENNIGEVRKDVSILNNLMEERERDTKEKFKNLDDKLDENKRKRRKEREEVNKRMRNLEDALKASSLESKEAKKSEIFNDKFGEELDESNIIGEKEKKKQDKNNDKDLAPNEKFDWYKSVHDELTEAAAKYDAINEVKEKRKEEKEKERKKNKKERQNMKSIKKWFGQESPVSSEVSSESDDASENENDEERVNRKERNRIRRKRNLENRKNLKAEIATKASHTIGCHPIKEEEVNYLNDKLGDISKAREQAVRNFLKEYLQFNVEELADVEIVDTKKSAKGDSTIYAVLKNLDTIKEMHWRISEIRNPEVILRNYVPPQYWSRYMFLSRECTTYRNNNTNMKTQMRFGTNDVEIFLKKKGSGETLKKVPYETITDPRKIPIFEHSMKWTQRNEKPLRRKLVVYGTASERMDDETSSPKKGIQRQRSSDITGKCDKKQRRNDMSSSSSGGSQSDEEI